MLTKYYLYKITNLSNGKKYIGVTINPPVRWKAHRTARIRNTIVTQAIQKYGVDNFEFKILITGPKEIILKLEKWAIKFFKTKVPTGYNLSAGGESGSVGCKFTMEFCQQRSKQLKERFANLQYRRKHSQIVKQRFIDPKYREKNKLQLNKIHADPSLLAKRIQSLKKYYTTPAGIKRRKELSKRNTFSIACNKRILVNDIEYASLKEASKILGISYEILKYRLKRENYPEYQYLN